METTTTTTPSTPSTPSTLLSQVFRSNHLAIVLQYRALCSDLQVILVGDGQFLAARPYIASQLHQLGYDYLSA